MLKITYFIVFTFAIIVNLVTSKEACACYMYHGPTHNDATKSCCKKYGTSTSFNAGFKGLGCYMKEGYSWSKMNNCCNDYKWNVQGTVCHT